MSKYSDVESIVLSGWIDLKNLYTFFNKYGVISAEVTDNGDTVDFTITLKNNARTFNGLDYYNSETFRDMLLWIIGD